jgi:hypothetical protein
MMERLYDTELTSVPQEAGKAIRLSRHCTSGCGHLYKSIRLNHPRFEKISEIGYDLPFD